MADQDEWTPAEVRAKALKHERESRIAYWTAAALTPLFVAVFLYNIVRFGDPALKAASAFGLSAFVSIAWAILGAKRRPADSPCVNYLRAEFEEKRRRLLWIRNSVLLVIPAAGFAWLGHGPLARARALGVQSPEILRLVDGPAPFLMLFAILGFLWFAFTHESGRMRRELDALKGLE